VPLLGRLAEGRIAQGGASGGGIALAGTVKQVEFAGGLYKTQLELAGKQKLSVTVLSLENPLDNPRSAYQVDDRVFILGALITDTTAAIEGYQGEEAVVVWSGYALAIPAGD